MMENRKILNTGDLDGFDKRKLPSLGFQVEVVLVAGSSVVTHLAPEQVSALAVAKLETPQEGPGELRTYWFPG
ncbi:hypothetical protein Patl1_35950 [Pistacia atlantica]|nr:hypothetical protein Patl1_35950 [Pistacia atlantica]